MRLNLTPEELAKRSTAILSVLEFESWLRPIDIARLSDLSFGVTKAALKRLASVGAVRSRSYSIRVIRGVTRKRYTSKPIVEYQMVTATAWPRAWLPAPPAEIVGARKVVGRCGCGD